MKVQAMHTQPLADRRRLSGGFEERVDSFDIGQPPLQIAIHDSEGRTRPLQRGQVVRRPVPEADTEAHFLQTRGAPFDGAVTPEHLGTGGKRECHGFFQCVCGHRN